MCVWKSVVVVVVVVFGDAVDCSQLRGVFELVGWAEVVGSLSSSPHKRVCLCLFVAAFFARSSLCVSEAL